MASFAGLRGTGDFATDERPKNFREFILWANPNGRAPMFALMSKMGSEKTTDPEFNWFEETQQIIRLHINDATPISAVATTITVDSGALQLVAGNQILIEKTELAVYDNEVIEVASVTSDTVFEAIRGVQGTTAAIIPDDSFILVVGTAFEEGTAKAAFSTRNPTKKTNFTQIFKTGMGITRTADETTLRTGDSMTNDQKRKTFDHSVEIEHALMWGNSFEDLTGTKPKRTMGGLREFLITNTKIYTVATTENDLLDDFFKVFDFDSAGAGDERIVFAGNGALNAINKIARASASTRINFQGTIDMFGMNVQKWVIPQGTFFVRSHPLMNVHPKFTNSLFVINPMGIKWRPLTDTFLKKDTQTPGTDSKEQEWLTEGGLEVQHEETMAYIGNITAA